MVIGSRFSRRTLLKGLGVTIALPWLESLEGSARAAAETAPAKFPNRMVFMYIPNGVVIQQWAPADGDVGKDYKLTPILQPLAELKDDFNVITGLAADKARAFEDGAGDFARAMGAYLTGVHPRKVGSGAPPRHSISADQVAAARVGKETRLPSLEIGTDASIMYGNCDSDYACVFTSTVSWESETKPLPKIPEPRRIFEALFRNEPAMATQAAKKSVLDFVLEEGKRVGRGASAADRAKIDEYLESIRAVEKQLLDSESRPATSLPQIYQGNASPKDFKEHVQLLCDLMVLGLQSDTTRVITCVLANERSNRLYSELGVVDGHQTLSSHRNDPKRIADVVKINTYHVQMLAYLLKKMKAVKEGDGTLLDHSMVAYGGGMGDCNRRTHDNLPTLLCGRGGGTIATGRHIHYEKETPICNLWLAMLDRMDVKRDSFGDSTGRLVELKG